MLQLNADALATDKGPLVDAMNVVDDQTTIISDLSQRPDRAAETNRLRGAAVHCSPGPQLALRYWHGRTVVRDRRRTPAVGSTSHRQPDVASLLRTPLAGSARKQLMVLSFTGRKTGKQYSLPLSAHVIDNDLYALTGAHWKQNFRGGAAAEVVYDGKTTAMRGSSSERPGRCGSHHRCAQSYGVQRAQRMIGLKFRDHRIPTPDEFGEAIDRQKLVAIKFTPVT